MCETERERENEYVYSKYEITGNFRTKYQTMSAMKYEFTLCNIYISVVFLCVFVVVVLNLTCKFAIRLCKRLETWLDKFDV